MFKILKTLFLAPLYLVGFGIGFLFYLFITITGIGPILQYFYGESDKTVLNREQIQNKNPNDVRIIEVPANVHSCSQGRAYKVFAIYSEPKVRSKFPPLVIPNGLGATAILLSKLQEVLVRNGFRVLSFDRFGVGLSDENLSGRSPTAMDVVRELDFVMSAVNNQEKWIILGPSMGSIVAQCYICHHAEKVIGFLNMDGLPYPFLTFGTAFERAGLVYKLYGAMVFTGVFRPFIRYFIGKSKHIFQSDMFTIDVLIAQMNQKRFLSNIAYEMKTMIDCCRMVDDYWADYSILRMPAKEHTLLVKLAPTLSIDFDFKDKPIITTERSISEAGDSYGTENDTKTIMDYFLNISRAYTNHSESTFVDDVNENLRLLSKDSLTKTSFGRARALFSYWRQNLVVRVMSARNHDFGNFLMNSFYTQEMKNMAAAEHNQHCIFAKNGKRTNYPKLSHQLIFTKYDEITKYMTEIAELVESH